MRKCNISNKMRFLICLNLALLVFVVQADEWVQTLTWIDNPRPYQFFKLVCGLPGPQGPPAGSDGGAKTIEGCLQRAAVLAFRFEILHARLKNRMTTGGGVASSVMSTASSGSKCDSSGSKFTYRFVDKAMTFGEARAHCKHLGGVLPHSEVRNIVDRRHVMETNGVRSSGATLWWGMTDGAVEGEWRWEDGSLVDESYVGWYGFDGRGGAGENCACDQHGWELADVPCSRKYKFMCQFDTCKFATGM